MPLRRRGVRLPILRYCRPQTVHQQYLRHGGAGLQFQKLCHQPHRREGYTTCRFYDRMGNLTTLLSTRAVGKERERPVSTATIFWNVVDTISPLQEHPSSYSAILMGISPAGSIRQLCPSKAMGRKESAMSTDSDGNCIRILYPDGGVERRFW